MIGRRSGPGLADPKIMMGRAGPSIMKRDSDGPGRKKKIINDEPGRQQNKKTMGRAVLENVVGRAAPRPSIQKFDQPGRSAAFLLKQ